LGRCGPVIQATAASPLENCAKSIMSWKLANRTYENTNSKIEGFYLDANASGTMTWIQNSAVTSSEVFADMFLGWVYNKWDNDPHGFGNARRKFMTDNMANWITQAMSSP
jgi:hypothetical protein